MNQLKRIGPKMLISLLATFVAVLGAFLILAIVQTTFLSDEMAKDLTQNTVENYANQMATLFTKTDSMVLGLKLAVEQFEDIPAENRRSHLDHILEQTVANENTGILGAWACFEPNQLDGMDSQYQNTAMSDATGRYCSYYFDSGNGMEQSTLADYDVSGAGDYYLVPFQTGNSYVTEPFDYQVGDHTVKVVSVGHPVSNRAGQVVGVIGIDYTLDYFNILNDAIELYDTGYGKLLTDEGITVAHFDDSLLGTPDTDYATGDIADEIKKSLQGGITWVGHSFARVLNADAYKAFANISLGTSGINWIYAVVAPEAEVMSTANRMIVSISIIGIVSEKSVDGAEKSAEIHVRAGELGKNVTASIEKSNRMFDEIKLALEKALEESKAVDEINALAGSSSDLLNFVAENVQEDYQDMLKAAKSYTNDAVYISDMTSDLSATSEELLASVQILLRTIGEVSQAAQEGAQTTGTVAAQTTDISNNVSMVADNMQQTHDTADELETLIRRFRL